MAAENSLMYTAFGFVLANQSPGNQVKLSELVSWLEEYQQQITGKELRIFLKNSGIQFDVNLETGETVVSIVKKVSVSFGMPEAYISSGVHERRHIDLAAEDTVTECHVQSTTTNTSENVEASVSVVPEDEQMKRLVEIITASLLNPGDKLLVSRAGLIYQDKFNVPIGKCVGLRFNKYRKSQTEEIQIEFNSNRGPGHDYFTKS